MVLCAPSLPRRPSIITPVFIEGDIEAQRLGDLSVPVIRPRRGSLTSCQNFPPPRGVPRVPGMPKNPATCLHLYSRLFKTQRARPQGEKSDADLEQELPLTCGQTESGAVLITGKVKSVCPLIGNSEISSTQRERPLGKPRCRTAPPKQLGGDRLRTYKC